MSYQSLLRLLTNAANAQLPVSLSTDPNSAATSNNAGKSSAPASDPSSTNPGSPTSPPTASLAPTPTPASNAQQSSTSISQSVCIDWAGDVVTIDITSFTPSPLPLRPRQHPTLLPPLLLLSAAAAHSARALALADGENIKWPELNAHSDSGAGEDHALPVMQGARARGFVSGDDAPPTYPPSGIPRRPGRPVCGAAPPAHESGARGATFNEGMHGAPAADWGGEAIATTQMGRASPSPGPGVMYIGDGRTGSPAPGMYADARTTSPGPQAAYGGLSSSSLLPASTRLSLTRSSGLPYPHKEAEDVWNASGHCNDTFA
ncbi:hypothetical protein DFH08DRAFT_1088340, partial [Mycena albidolilacea]